MTLSRLELAARELGLAVERFALALAAEQQSVPSSPSAPSTPDRNAALTTADVALITSRHPTTVRRALEAGDLHGKQSGRGGHWYVRRACADAWAIGERCEHQAAHA